MGNYLKEIKSAWNKYIYEGIIENIVDPTIRKSWERCKKYKVDHKKGQGRRASSLEIKGIIEKNKELLEVARPIMVELNSFVAGSGFVLVLTDAEGYIIESIGEEKIKNMAEKLNFEVGALWTEEEVGTNAIGLCIKENRPIQVIGAEHYCEYHHSWTCSAAPIHDDKGNLIGVLDMSGSSYKAHKHTLGIVVAAAYSIENQLHIIKSHELIDATLESISDGMIITDKNYKINKMNFSAEKILRLKREEAVGMDIRKILRDVAFEDIISMKTSFMEKIDCDFFINDKKVVTCSAKITPAKRVNNLIGIIIVFREMKYLHKTVNIVTGNKARYCFNDIKTKNSKMENAIREAQKFANTKGCVLIEGESGTGKELFAHSIHNYSRRSSGPFVPVNCASIPRELVESELFGYERGAFTGAIEEGKPGKFELANKGTIFLDEIGELPLDIQAKLLRVLDTHYITRIGGKYEKRLDVRVICATNRNLYEEVRKRNFREDLYYRLNVFKVNIPPLRERVEDVEIYINYFLEKLNRMYLTNKKVDDKFLEIAEKYEWKGNVRELENAIERAYHLCDEEIITKEYLPEEIRFYDFYATGEVSDSKVLSLKEAERKAIIYALIETGGDVVKAGQILDISKSSMYRKINEYDIDVSLYRQ